MADTGYFDSVSANLKTGVGAQVKGISEGVKANSEAGVSPSVNALDTGVKAAAAIGGLADGLSEAAMLPVLGAMGMKGMACLPISKQLDPVFGVDIHSMACCPPCFTFMSVCSCDCRILPLRLFLLPTVEQAVCRQLREHSHITN